ncbi:hypothetical protein N7468_003908 [Penicillium chermesinum]|uniref:Uncharacterized protein n=1 Tax=Penicillium chermesinum TaxID=63820 RepID=A0A9W9TTU5_9EURO|nr:uncharacterized protein N7468_003908 [Penicillium chermesinum]KAJ5239289.1 hypothetical protein N7468_003908 [Penicillium chermesinum]KAJ6164918.1 hypothetical protein N7470_003590 [Penicillium chermesinum]
MLKMEIPDNSTNSHELSVASQGAQKPKKKRIRNWTAEDRAVHREFEKSRREAFSERLMHIIVDASIAHHQAQQAASRKAADAIESLLSERDDLLKEVNYFRSLYQPGTSIPRQARPISPTVHDLLTTSKAGTSSSIAGSSRNMSIGTVSDQASPTTLGSFMPVVSEDLPVHEPVPLPSGHPLPSRDSVPPSNYSVVDWNWSSPEKETANMPVNLLDEPSMLWTPAPDIPIATPPKDANAEYNPGHLVKNSAMFWTHHPGQFTPTPPQDAAHFGLNGGFVAENPLVWPPYLPMAAVSSTESRNIALSNQMIQFSGSQLAPNQSI